MDHDTFIGKVQNRLELSSHGDAHKATRAVLSTLGERLQHGEATDLAAPLPDEIGRYLADIPETHGDQFSYDTFIARIADRGDIDEPDAAYHAQELMNILHEAVPPGELDDVRANLPDDYADLFALIGAETRPAEQQDRPDESEDTGLIGRLLG